MKLWSVVLCALFAISMIGCGDEEVVYNPDSLYPENWQSTYVKKKACAKSPTHGSNYVEVWVSPDAEAAFDDRSLTMPMAGVLLKPQFADDGCTEPAAFTAMRPDSIAADGKITWFWQRAEINGDLSSNGANADNFCVKCHNGCAGGICSTP